jgi:sphingolipid 4-desaturase/C4-monooxygenase
MNERDFTFVDYPEPHIKRSREILKAHPEVRSLMGRNPWTAVVAISIISLHFAIAIALKSSSWPMVLLSAWTIGAVIDHALFVIIHDLSHNLVFKGATKNKLMGIVTNFPMVMPPAIGFRNYHLLHHKYQGEMDYDADLASKSEANFVGTNPIKKALWLLFFPIVEGVIRPLRVKRVNFLEFWSILNLSVIMAINVWIFTTFGAMTFTYLLLSLFFSVGLSPLGGRWIQEHYIFEPGQETYSYYGPLNYLSLNVGYHNEHHDFMMIPWSNLPKLKKMAPSFYDGLYSHKSWTKVLVTFIFSKDISLFSRIIRTNHKDKNRDGGYTTKETQKIMESAVNVVSADSCNPT